MIPLPSWRENEGANAWQFFETLGQMVVDLKVNTLVMEDTFVPGDYPSSLSQQIARFGMIMIGDMVAHVCTTKRDQPVEFSVVSPAQWRKAWLGSARAPKGLVKEQSRKWLKQKSVEAAVARGWLVDNDNLADALGILAYACAAIDPGYAAKQVGLFKRKELEFENEERDLR